MSKNLVWKTLALLLVLTVLVTACGPTSEPAAPKPTTTPAAITAPEPTEAPAL